MPSASQPGTPAAHAPASPLSYPSAAKPAGSASSAADEALSQEHVPSTAFLVTSAAPPGSPPVTPNNTVQRQNIVALQPESGGGGVPTASVAAATAAMPSQQQGIGRAGGIGRGGIGRGIGGGSNYAAHSANQQAPVLPAQHHQQQQRARQGPVPRATLPAARPLSKLLAARQQQAAAGKPVRQLQVAVHTRAGLPKEPQRDYQYGEGADYDDSNYGVPAPQGGLVGTHKPPQRPATAGGGRKQVGAAAML